MSEETEWFYGDHGNPVGPVSQAALAELARSGSVRAETLVWRSGFTEWVPFDRVRGEVLPETAQTARAQPGDLFCTACRKPVSSEQAIRLLGRVVCANCKPAFIQALREGAPLPGAAVFGTFGQRAAAKIIDNVILLATLNTLIIYGFVWLFPNSPDPRDGGFLLQLVITSLIPAVIACAYSVFFLARYGATPGKMALGLRVVTATGARLSAWRALARYFAEMLSEIVLYIGYILAAFDAEKRTLHDHICGTRVIQS